MPDEPRVGMNPDPGASRKAPPSSVRIPHPPATNEQWKQLRAACKQAARAQGKTGRARSIEAARLELDAIAEASHRVRDPAAVRMIATKPEPEGFARTPAGLLVKPPR